MLIANPERGMMGVDIAGDGMEEPPGVEGTGKHLAFVVVSKLNYKK